MRRRGFSLIEALITMALMAGALGVMASLMAAMNRLHRETDAQDQRLALVLHGLEMMRAEVEEATEILSATGSLYQFRKLNPSTDSLLQNPPLPAARLVYAPDAPGALGPEDGWNPRNLYDQVVVSYVFNSGNLVRTALVPGSFSSSYLCEGINGFRVYRDGWGVDHLEISVLAGGVLHAYSAAVGSKLP